MTSRAFQNVQKLNHIIDVVDYGAIGDDATDNTAALTAAIAAASAMGGAKLVFQSGKIYRFSGELNILSGVVVDLGAFPGGATLMATSANNGIVLHGGAEIYGRIAQNHPNYTGPLLDINVAKSSTQYNRGVLNGGNTRFDVLLDGVYSTVKDATNVGLRVIDATATATPRGISWLEGKAQIQRFWRSCLISSENLGYITSNTFDLLCYGFKEGLRVQYVNKQSLNIIYDNRFKVITQTAGADRSPGLPVYFDAAQGDLYFYSWDFDASNRDTNYSGNHIVLGPDCRDNTITTVVSNLVDAIPIVGALTTQAAFENYLDVRSTFLRSPDYQANHPVPKIMCGAQDNILYAARRRTTVTIGGTTPITLSELDAATNLLSNAFSKAAFEDCTVTIELPASGSSNYRANVIGMDFFIKPDKAKIETSGDGSTWVTIAEAGYAGDTVPKLFYVDSVNPVNCRYMRFTWENDTPKTFGVRSLYANNSGETAYSTPFLERYRPAAIDRTDVVPEIGGGTSGIGHFVNGVKIIGTQRTGWTAATGTATRTTFATSTVTTEQLAERLKALLDDLIAHGIIGS